MPTSPLSSDKKIHCKFGALREALASGKALGPSWMEFAAAVRAAEPNHIKRVHRVLSTVEEFRGQRARDEITIVDHGCGGGFTLLYLVVLGYRDVYGISYSDIGDAWNPLFREVFNDDTERFHVYDGMAVPLGDDFADIIFSQQVLEHVTPEMIVPYYREEGRVLKPGGWAIHEVPHRFVPYDSHTRTWFLHYLPKPLYGPLQSVLGTRRDFDLYLRTPMFHRRKAETYIGRVRDTTWKKITTAPRSNEFDGPKWVANLREIIFHFTRIPIFGRVLAIFFACFTQLETVTVKPDRPSMGRSN